MDANDFLRSQTLNPKPETGLKPHPEMDANDFLRSQTLNPTPETGLKPHPEMDANDFLRSQSLMRPFESPVIRRLPSPGDSTALTMLSFFSIAAQRGSRGLGFRV